MYFYHPINLGVTTEITAKSKVTDKIAACFDANSEYHQKDDRAFCSAVPGKTCKCAIVAAFNCNIDGEIINGPRNKYYYRIQRTISCYYLRHASTKNSLSWFICWWTGSDHGFFQAFGAEHWNLFHCDSTSESGHAFINTRYFIEDNFHDGQRGERSRNRFAKSRLYHEAECSTHHR